MKNSFILYHSYKKHLSILTNEQRGRLFMAIFEYSEKQTIPKLEPVSMMAFNFIVEDLDINKKKWEETVEMRSKAGKKGAEARWKDHQKSVVNKDKIAKNGKRILPMANDGKNAVNVNVNVNDNVNDIYKGKKKHTSLKKKSTKAIQVQEAIQLKKIVQAYNTYFKKNTLSTRGFEKNYLYWKDVHTWEKIEEAIKNASKDKFWKNKMTLTILFRQKNSNGEEVDYIEDLSSRRSVSSGDIAII